MPVIRDVGRFLEEDGAGRLSNPATGTELQEKWRPALEALASGCRHEVKDRLHSFYVRGSVACGRAVEGSSDLDTVLIVDDDQGERRPEWQRPLAARVLVDAPFVTDVEVVMLGRGALLAAAADLGRAEPVMAQWVFLLAVGARCLEGVDLLPELGRFRAGPEVAFVLRGLPPAMREFEAKLARARRRDRSPDVDAELRRLCAWTCKKLLRSGAELAMLSERRFTRDLGPCARQLARRLPQFAGSARQLLEWAIDPPVDLSGLEQVARELEPALTRAAIEGGLVMDPCPDASTTME